jgi:hypothetical protein
LRINQLSQGWEDDRFIHRQSTCCITLQHDHRHRQQRTARFCHWLFGCFRWLDSGFEIVCRALLDLLSCRN